ncbi:serine/threonine-protein kinase [Micromonospora sp. CPCC 206061]|uniref:serine/threonine-protein kinase n=1 Tax=Micromonospora sp. CPCC 206061 TaxID=3122410 RepID=UPI002FF421FF
MPTGTLTGSTGGAPGEPSPAGPLLPGDPRQLGPYRVVGRLGEGGMGTVFLATDVAARGGAPVAIKVIRSEYARDEVFRARFRREAEAARRVARFCTAQVLDVVLDGDVAYLVTEFIDGPTLAAWIAQGGPLRGSMLDSLATGVAAALNGIHAAGIVHRDLKAGNVLLSRLGPKVIDFGIARATDHAVARTDSGPVIGTPAYMAPEQFDGKIVAASDVFAWGCVITYAATGRTPFGAGTPYELMRRVISDEPDLSGLEPPLRDLVGRTLCKRPEQRPTARELLLALVGDRTDPVLATTKMLDATDWTLPDAPHDAAPSRGERRRIPYRSLALAAVAVATLVTALTLLPGLGTPGNDGAQPGPTPTGTVTAGTATPANSASSGGSPASPGGSRATAGASPAGTAGRSISLDVRVPESGTAVLGIGEVDRYHLVLVSGSRVYLQGVAENCGAHLLPWTLVRGGRTVAGANLTCGRHGPLQLDAGDYELRVGGPGVDGRYALRLIRA